ncbi:hypothetical protein AAFF_G00288730 [Aldrovandia affinis]|uniref:Cytidine monophosphate-N-acetylneuraminic acid hydroxylase n=1 Tax=Aldrovandia affinis TaxID=143900 RepID=A0AAD7SS59_9TELE|nr:hypothetical protein AAFF_G00288730 [Aldrovandia affinis]
MAQNGKLLLTLDSEAVLTLKSGVNFKKSQEDGKCYIIYKDEHGVKACKNQCKHQGGLFIKDMEDIDGSVVRCTKHYWKLDASSMKYVNPPDSFEQDQLAVVWKDGNLLLMEVCPPDPWLVDPRDQEELEVGEVMVTYLTHACMELKLGSKRMLFDPWLTGPAFARGWWLLHNPPDNSLEKLCKADFIYISHMHSDHLSYPTLKTLSERCPDMPIYVGDTSRPVFWYLDRSGVTLTNINVVPFGIWQDIDKHLRFMILLDGVHPEMDTCIIVDYKGHMILNTVDCSQPNKGRLPHGVDLMMSDFAGGAAGFPATFSGGKYTESWKTMFIKNERKKLLNYKVQLVKSLQPKIYCPFAGYFTEAHPSDKYIKEINLKNSAEELNSLIKKHIPEILAWTPKPGAVLDLGLALRDRSNSEAITDPPPGTQIYKKRWEFDQYVNHLDSFIDDEIFRHAGWVQFYYTWAGFKNYDLVIRVVETDEDFNPLPEGYDYLVDFLDLSFPRERPDKVRPYVEIKNRVGVIRHVVKRRRDPDCFGTHFDLALTLVSRTGSGEIQMYTTTGSGPTSKQACP